MTGKAPRKPRPFTGLTKEYTVAEAQLNHMGQHYVFFGPGSIWTAKQARRLAAWLLRYAEWREWKDQRRK